MSQTTAHEFIQYLMNRIDIHRVEITKLENLITSFNDLSHPNSYPIAEEQLIGDRTPNPLGEKFFPGYDPAASIAEKILCALREIDTGYNVDIAAVLVRYEPGSTLPEMVKKIGGTLSTLKGSLKILAVRSGKKFKYTLPDQMTR